MKESKFKKTSAINQYYKAIHDLTKSKTEGSKIQESSQDEMQIQQIRKLGQQVFRKSDQKNLHFRTFNYDHQEQVDYNPNSLQIHEWKKMNLYDKYKHQNKLKTERKIQSKAEKIALQMSEVKEKQWKNPKYLHTKSKYQKQSHRVNTLNYQKRIKNMHQIVKKEEDREIGKKKKIHYERKKASFADILKRGRQMNEKKDEKIKRMRNQNYAREIDQHTFHPKLVARQSNSLEKTYLKRMAKNGILLRSRQKDLLMETVLCHNFIPKTNSNEGISSPTKKIWEKMEEKNSRKKKTINSSSRQKDYRQQQKTNKETTRVTLKNQNDMSFLMNK